MGAGLLTFWEGFPGKYVLVFPKRKRAFEMRRNEEV